MRGCFCQSRHVGECFAEWEQACVVFLEAAWKKDMWCSARANTWENTTDSGLWCVVLVYLTIPRWLSLGFVNAGLRWWCCMVLVRLSVLWWSSLGFADAGLCWCWSLLTRLYGIGLPCHTLLVIVCHDFIERNTPKNLWWRCSGFLPLLWTLADRQSLEVSSGSNCGCWLMNGVWSGLSCHCWFMWTELWTTHWICSTSPVS